MDIYRFNDTKKIISSLLVRKIPFRTAFEMASIRMKLTDEEKVTIQKAYMMYDKHLQKRISGDPEKSTDPYRHRMSTNAGAHSNMTWLDKETTYD